MFVASYRAASSTTMHVVGLGPHVRVT